MAVVRKPPSSDSEQSLEAVAQASRGTRWLLLEVSVIEPTIHEYVSFKGSGYFYLRLFHEKDDESNDNCTVDGSNAISPPPAVWKN